jgi:hypothetical protein
MPTESEIQLLTEGSGPKVRTLESTESAGVDATGAAQADDVRHQQVVALADPRGDLVDPSLSQLILEELRGIRATLELISTQLD